MTVVKKVRHKSTKGCFTGPRIGMQAQHIKNMLMKTLSHPGHGSHKSLNKDNWSPWTLKTFHLSLERLLQFWTRWWGVSAYKQRGSLQSHVSLNPLTNVHVVRVIIIRGDERWNVFKSKKSSSHPYSSSSEHIKKHLMQINGAPLYSVHISTVQH